MGEHVVSGEQSGESEVAAQPPAGNLPAAGWRKRDVLVFDVDEPARARTERRGRPRGTLEAIVADDRPPTADDLRFLRAFCQGVDPRQAARSYLSHNLHNDGRSALGYMRQLLVRMAARAQEHPEGELALRLVQDLQHRLASATRQLSAPAHDAAPAPAAPAVSRAASEPAKETTTRPTLEEFASRFDADMYSEAELLQLWEEEFGAGPAPAPAIILREQPVPAVVVAAPMPVDRRLEIIDWLAPRLAQPVSAKAPLSVWLEPAVAAALRAQPFGLTTVEQLAIWINTRGAGFYRGVPGLGRARALRLLAWLVDHEAQIGVKLRPSLRALVHGARDIGEMHPGAASGRNDVVPVTRALTVQAQPRYALVPLEQLHWPAELDGRDGALRASQPSLMLVDGEPVANDAQALAYWLRNVVAGKSPETVRSYRGAVERFVLWALLERKRALSSMSLDDLVAYREFLYAPPAHWCSQTRVQRLCEEWRPLRGPLSEKAVRQVLDVVKQLYAYWYDHAYLRGNPMRALKAPTSNEAVRVRLGAKKATLDVGRSFAREDLLAMQRTLDEMEEGPTTRRLRAILSLFIESGVRRAEVEHLTLGKLTPMRDWDNSLSEVMKVEVMGKGRRLREVPVLAHTLAHLEAHYADRVALARAGKLPVHFAALPRDETPVLSVLRVTADGGGARRGLSPAAAPRVATFDGRLDSKTLYGILKAFFKRVGQRGDLVRGQADFARASTHWLRHTFALQFLAANPGQLPALQGLLGHEDLSTTSTYVRTNLDERARAVARMERFF